MCKLTIHGNHIDVTESIREAAEEKLKKITKISSESKAIAGTSATMTFKQEGVGFEVHLVYRIKNKDVVAKKSHEDLYTAMSKAFDTVLRQVRKAKPEQRAKTKTPLIEAEVDSEYLDDEDDFEQID
jgi:putative sigma-54 modulation protein